MWLRTEEVLKVNVCDNWPKKEKKFPLQFCSKSCQRINHFKLEGLASPQLSRPPLCFGPWAGCFLWVCSSASPLGEEGAVLGVGLQGSPLHTPSRGAVGDGLCASISMAYRLELMAGAWQQAWAHCYRVTSNTSTKINPLWCFLKAEYATLNPSSF